ncbi:MAG TPA: hypothetical protein VFR97_14800 [Capillimicrobium sp.]|nr:hypothetical protein [Capillimicrobium sp.]
MLRPHAGEDPSHVLVIATLGAPQRRLLRRRRVRRVAPGPPPSPVPVTRATVIDATPFDDEAAARRWLDGVERDAHAAAALATLNRVIAAHRIAVADGGVRDATRAQALAVRVGYGRGEEVAEGRHTAAVELPPPADGPGGRTAALRPVERLAALLAGRDAVLACEELTLRARTDLDARRTREAALMLRVALEAAIAELEPWADRGDLDERLAELREARGEVGSAANRALQGALDDREEAAVARVLGRVEAALRARTAAGFE